MNIKHSLFSLLAFICFPFTQPHIVHLVIRSDELHVNSVAGGVVATLTLAASFSEGYSVITFTARTVSHYFTVPIILLFSFIFYLFLSLLMVTFLHLLHPLSTDSEV